MQNSSLDIYADDSTLTSSGATVDIKTDIDAVDKWCDRNKMVLKTGKNKSCIITTWQKRAHVTQKNLDLSLGDAELQKTESYKLFGVIIDQNLTFNAHKKTVFTKVSRSIALLRRIKKFLPIDARVKFDNAFILPHLEYCCTVWGDSSEVSSLCKLQIRAAKVISDKPYDFSATETLRQLKGRVGERGREEGEHHWEEGEGHWEEGEHHWEVGDNHWEEGGKTVGEFFYLIILFTNYSVPNIKQHQIHKKNRASRDNPGFLQPLHSSIHVVHPKCNWYRV